MLRWQGVTSSQEADLDYGRRSILLESIDESEFKRRESVVPTRSPSLKRKSLTAVLETDPKAADAFALSSSGDKKFDMLKAEYLDLLEVSVQVNYHKFVELNARD